MYVFIVVIHVEIRVRSASLFVLFYMNSVLSLLNCFEWLFFY